MRFDGFISVSSPECKQLLQKVVEYQAAAKGDGVLMEVICPSGKKFVRLTNIILHNGDFYRTSFNGKGHVKLGRKIASHVSHIKISIKNGKK